MSDFDKFLEDLSMMKLEENYPAEIKALDELHAREKEGKLTRVEREQLERSDNRLVSEMERYRLHYRVNWEFMSPEVKAEHRRRVEEWRAKRNG